MYLSDREALKYKTCNECENKEKLMIFITCHSKRDPVPWYVCAKCIDKRYSDDFYHDSENKLTKCNVCDELEDYYEIRSRHPIGHPRGDFYTTLLCRKCQKLTKGNEELLLDLLDKKYTHWTLDSLDEKYGPRGND